MSHCDQIGRFLKVFVDKLYNKSSPNGHFLATLKNVTSKYKLLCLGFDNFLKSLGYLLFQHLVTLFVTELPTVANLIDIRNVMIDYYS